MQGWRDWNQYQGDIYQADMEAAFRALASTKLGSIDGKPASLASVGYNDGGLDDVWQLCGAYGPRKYSYHDGGGNPVVDTSKVRCAVLRRCACSSVLMLNLAGDGSSRILR